MAKRLPNEAQPDSGAMPIRLEWRSPAELDDNPANWRQHPGAQSEGLEAVLREVGWAGALLYNETTGRLIDGHARKKLPEDLAVDGKVPVLIGAWTLAQERLILATLDPLGSMAEVDHTALANLLIGIDSEDERVAALLRQIGEDAGAIAPDFGEVDPSEQGRLDQKSPVRCPHCGEEFTP